MMKKAAIGLAAEVAARGKAVANELLRRKRRQIEEEMLELLNKLILPYKDHIARVELSEELEDFAVKLYHTAGNAPGYFGVELAEEA